MNPTSLKYKKSPGWGGGVRGGCCRSLCTSSPPLPALTVGSRRWPGVVQLQPCALGIASIALPGKETQPQCGLEGLCEGSNCSRAAGVGIVRSGCVSCRRMLMRLQKCSSKSSGLPASCLHSYPGGNERFLGPIPIIFSFFPLVYWCFHLLAQSSGGRMCPWCTMAFTAALSLPARHPENNYTFESLFLAWGNTISA